MILVQIFPYQKNLSSAPLMRSKFLLKIILLLFCLSTHVNQQAQVCSGSLGDAVVNVDFGSGSNPGTPLSPSITTYTFTTTSCPDDGSYTVVSSTSGCFANSWHNVPEVTRPMI